jgi:hypothetical protein
MMLATMAVVAPAIVRWPFDLIQNGPPIWPLLIYLVPPLLLLIYVWISKRQVYGVMGLGVGLMIAVFGSFIALPALPAWMELTNWIRALSNTFGRCSTKYCRPPSVMRMSGSIRSCRTVRDIFAAQHPASRIQ